MKLGLALVVFALASPWQAALSNPVHVTALSSWDHKGFGASPGDLTVIGDTVYFAGNEPVSGRSLWKSDGSAAGTVRVKAFHSGVDGSQPSQSPNQLTNAGGTLFFFTGSRGVWKSDGTEQGTVLVKLYFSVTKEEQARRFERRRTDPLRQWKLSEIDLQAQDRWDEFTARKYEMLVRTDTRAAPWVIVRANDKQQARLNAIKVILNSVDYKERDPELAFEPDPDIVVTAAEEIALMRAQRRRSGRFAG